MRSLFTNAPWFVPTMDSDAYKSYELDRRVEQAEKKTVEIEEQDRA